MKRSIWKKLACFGLTGVLVLGSVTPALANVISSNSPVEDEVIAELVASINCGGEKVKDIVSIYLEEATVESVNVAEQIMDTAETDMDAAIEMLDDVMSSADEQLSEGFKNSDDAKELITELAGASVAAEELYTKAAAELANAEIALEVAEAEYMAAHPFLKMQLLQRQLRLNLQNRFMLLQLKQQKQPEKN